MRPGEPVKTHKLLQDKQGNNQDVQVAAGVTVKQPRTCGQVSQPRHTLENKADVVQQRMEDNEHSI
jgi:hypothetical protein